jgi:NitT/TauT family transport system substrate-binding protein
MQRQPAAGSRAGFLIGAAAALTLAPRFGRAQTLEKIKFCGVPTDDLSPVYWAIENELYKKAGLDVEFIPTGSGTAATQAVVSGTYELGKGSPISAFAGYMRGLPVALIANGVLWETNNPWSLGLVAADSTIKTGADLNGKTLCAAAINDLSVVAMKAWTDKNGGDSKTLKFVEIPNSAAGEAVAEHRVAACQLNEPQLHAAIDSGKLKVLAPFLGAVASSYVLTAYFTRPDWARNNKTIVDKFVRTTYESATYTNSHPADTAPLVARITKIPLEVIRTMTRAHTATSTDPSMIQPAVDVAAKYGLLPRTFAAKEIYFNG